MTKLQYFTRHGQCSGDRLTVGGQDQVHSVKEKLVQYGFSPKTALSSPANRCVETTQLLAPNAYVTQDEELRSFACYRIFVEIEGKTVQDAPYKWNFSNWGNVLKIVQDIKPSLVACHDSNAVILAFKLLEARGVQIDWNNQPDHFTNLQMGHGILINGTDYEYIAP